MANADDRGTVLDVTTTLAGAYAAHLLVSAGVRVVRAEPAAGHPLASWRAGGPLPAGEPSPLYAWLSGGVERAQFDPARPRDVDAVSDWASRVEALLWEPGSGLPLDGLRRAAPDTTITAISAFGRDGPWADRAATEMTLQALSGGPALRGSRSWPPACVGGRHGEYMVGVFAAVATLIGLRRRAMGSGGGVIDLSGFEAILMTQLFNPHTLETQAGGVRAARPKATVGDIIATKDGWVGFAVVNRLQHWWDFCAMIGRPDWADDRTLDPVVARTDRSAELNPVIAAWCGERTTAEIVELAALFRIPCVEVGNGETIPTLDGSALAGMYEANPDLGFLQPRAPFRMHPPIPGVGEAGRFHVPVRLADVRPPARPVRSGSIPDGSSGGRPFTGLRVADFTAFWAGPFLAHALAMFGADVIKVESTTRPDGARLMNQHPVTTPQWWERSAYFHATNTNKRGITLDMTREEGREVALRFVERCDVIVENFSPRVMESFGLSWEEVSARRPDIVMVRMPAFGLSGPWRDRTGFAMTMEQVSGMSWLSGFPEHSPIGLFGPCDPSAGMHALVALLAALEHRRRTGEGRLVEVPMVANALNVAGEQVIEHSAFGVRLDRDGNRGPSAAPQNCYRTSDRDDVQDGPRWVAISVETDRQWDDLVDALGGPGWASDPRLATHTGRRQHHGRIDEELEAWCAVRSATDIVRLLSDRGVPVAPVVHPTEHLSMEQLRHRRFFEEVEHPVHGRSVISTFPFRLPGDDGPVHRRPAPLLGQHNAEVLGDLLGLGADAIAGLVASGVIGTELRG